MFADTFCVKLAISAVTSPAIRLRVTLPLMALLPLPPPAAAIDLISPVRSASTTMLVALFMRLLLILAVTLKSSLPSPIRLMATAPPITLEPPPVTAPAKDSILPELEACTVRLDAEPLKVTLSTKASVLPLSQLVLDEPPALFCALAEMVADKVCIADPASANTKTFCVGLSTEPVIFAERLDSMVLKPKASATEEPLDAATPPAKEEILALLAPSPLPACTLMSCAVTVDPMIRASVWSPISFQVAVPVKANVPSLKAPEAATDWLLLRLLATTLTSPLPVLIVALVMLAVLPALRLAKVPPFWTTVWPSTV